MTPFLRIYDSVSNLRYRNPAFLSTPSLRDTSPYHKGRHGVGCATSPTIRRKRGKNARATEYCNLTGLPVPCESGYVKTRRYKQDAKDKAFRRGAYSNVRDPRKTQSDNVLRSIYAFRPNKPIKVTVKTRRRVADCARIRKVHRSDFTQM